MVQRALNTAAWEENGVLVAAPVFYKGQLYIGSADKFFYVLSSEDGKLLWEYKTDGSVIGTGAIADERVYFGSMDKHLYALSTDGKLEWRFLVGDKIVTTPTVSKGVLYFGASNGYLYALDSSDRKIIWKFRTGDEIVSDALIYKNKILFGSMNGYLYCLTDDGQLEWKFRTGDSILLYTPFTDGRRIYFGSADEHLYALSLDGELAWSFKTGDQLYNTAIVHDRVVYFGSRDRYMYALDAKDGTARWKFMTNIGIINKPQIHKNRILLSSDGLYALNFSGIKIWKFSVHPVYGSCGVSSYDKKIFLSCGDTFVRTVSEDGQLLWRFRTKLPPPTFTMLKKVIPPPKWDPDRFERFSAREKEAVRQFKPYTLDPEGEKKFFEGLDTTNLYTPDFKIYSEPPGLYKELEHEYRAKKKKDWKEERLQWEREFGLRK